MLRCITADQATHLPLHIHTYLAFKDGPHWNLDREIAGGRLKDMAKKTFDAFSRVMDLLTSKTSNLVKGATASEFELMFGNYIKPFTTTNFGIALQWLLVVHAWKRNIRTFERQLQRLSNDTMSTPSLKTFKPIPMLRQNVADLSDTIEREKACIEDGVRAAFAELREITKHQVESLYDVFGILLSEASALSTKAGNEIQLVIGSVTIQVCSQSQCHTRSHL
jgi:hypothetical protein